MRGRSTTSTANNHNCPNSHNFYNSRGNKAEIKQDNQREIKQDNQSLALISVLATSPMLQHRLVNYKRWSSFSKHLTVLTGSSFHSVKNALVSGLQVGYQLEVKQSGTINQGNHYILSVYLWTLSDYDGCPVAEKEAEQTAAEIDQEMVLRKKVAREIDALSFLEC
jgi:hypothetical protein